MAVGAGRDAADEAAVLQHGLAVVEERLGVGEEEVHEPAAAARPAASSASRPMKPPGLSSATVPPRPASNGVSAGPAS